MRKAGIFSAAILYTGLVTGQPTFQKYGYGAGSAKNHLLELSSGHIVSGIGALQSGTSILDSNGNIVHHRSYLVDSFLVLQSIKNFDSHEFVFAGGYYFPDNSGSIQPVVGKMDSLGNVMNANFYELNTAGTNIAGDIELVRNKSVVAWNKYSSSEGFNSFFALKIDSMGELEWAKDFGSGGHFRFFKEFPNGDLLAGMELDAGGAALARMDASGNIQWARSYIRPNGTMLEGRIESDSSFTVIGYTDRNNGSGTKLFMMRLNAIGDVQWCKGYDTPMGWITQWVDMDETLDGNYVVLANINISGGELAYLMKTDMNGDTLWTVSAGITNYHYEVYSLLAYSDGGFLFNGQAWGLGNFLFKADSLGHLPCPEHEHYYPVQVQDLFPVDSSLTLTSIDGAVRYPATVNDTIYPSVSLTDGCLITSIPRVDHKSKYNIRPNPNRGNFTVEFGEPLLKESYYSVFDMQGRLLFQRPLPAGVTLEQVDMSRYGKGTYLIKFTNADGVCYERVVLE